MDDLDSRLEHVKRQPGKPLGVEVAEFFLITVVVRWAENFVAHAALGHEGVGAFRRLGLGFFCLIECVKMPAQHMIDGLLLGEPDCLIDLTKEQRLGHGAVLLALGLEHDLVAFALGNNEPGDVEQRISAAGCLDLLGQRLDPVFLRPDGGINLQWRTRRAVVAAEIALPVLRAPAVAILKFLTPVASVSSVIPATWPITATLEVATAIVVTAPWAIAPVATTPAAWSVVTGKVSVRFCVVRFLRPLGEECHLQILQRIGVLLITHDADVYPCCRVAVSKNRSAKMTLTHADNKN